MGIEKPKSAVMGRLVKGIFYICLVIACAAAIFGWDCHKDTLSPAWIGFAVAFMIAGPAVGATYFITASKGRSVSVWTAIAIFAIAGGITYGTFYGANLYTARYSGDHTIRVRVIDKEHTTGQVRHNRRSKPRTVHYYKLMLEMPDGTERDLEVTGTQYYDTYEKKEYDMPVARGCFGMKVMQKSDMKLVGSEPRGRQDRRCRYVGSRPR